CVAASTTATVALFSSAGVCYTARAIDLPATTGYGEPIQKLFKLKDGESIVAAFSLDPRVTGSIDEDPSGDYYPLTHALAATSDGYALRFGLAAFREPSTRAGRRFARPAAGAEVVGVAAIHGSEKLLAATRKCRAMVCPADDVNYLSGPGKGVLLIKLGKDDRLLGFKASSGERDLLRVVTNRGAEKTVSTAKYRTTSRGGRGVELQKTGTLSAVIPDPPTTPMIPEAAE
ncbi:MAG: DNA gyrase C-terminal beta-propeller domain-containing protein, partial [Planctomycetota bacterium]